MPAPTPTPNRLPATTTQISLPSMTPEEADAIFDLICGLESAFFEAYDNSLVSLWIAKHDLPDLTPERPDDEGVPF